MGKRLIGSVGLKPGTDTGFDLDEKGQIHGYSDTQFALPVGSNDQVIYADSSATSGLAYGASAKSVLTGAQDVLYSSSANTLARLAAGTDGDVLTTHSTGSAPTWETPSGGGQLELIDSDLTSAASIWNSSTFSANMKTTYSELIVIGNMYWKTGSAYTEFGDTYINLNGITSGYNAANGYYYDGTTMTQLTKSTTTVGFISDDAMDLSSGEGMHVETTLAQVDGTTNIISYHSICTSSTGTSMILDTFLDIGSTDIITDVKLQASLAQWGTGSNFVIYGRKLT